MTHHTICYMYLYKQKITVLLNKNFKTKYIFISPKCMYVCMYVCMYDVCLYNVCMYDTCMYRWMHVCMYV